MKKIHNYLLLLTVLLCGGLWTKQVVAEEIVDTDQQKIQFELYEVHQGNQTNPDKPSLNTLDQTRNLPATGSILLGAYAFVGTVVVGLSILAYVSKRGQNE